MYYIPSYIEKNHKNYFYTDFIKLEKQNRI